MICVLEVTLHIEASVPLLGAGPTLALHTKPGIKLLPMTVIVLLRYANTGCMESAVIPGEDSIGSAVV